MSPVHVKLIGHDEWRDEDIEQLRSLLELPAELNIHRSHDDDLAVEILLAKPRALVERGGAARLDPGSMPSARAQLLAGQSDLRPGVPDLARFGIPPSAAGSGDGTAAATDMSRALQKTRRGPEVVQPHTARAVDDRHQRPSLESD